MRGRRSTNAGGLIRSKLAPPLRAALVIDRPRLIEQLLGDRPKRVTLINAPPGYGKTTLLTQWANQLRAAGFGVAWLTLDEDDDEPLTLLAYLTAALDLAGVDMGPLSPSAGEGQAGISAKLAFTAVIRALEQHAGRLVLLLEDCHRLRGDRSEALLNQLIERLPENVFLAVSSRRRPALRLAMLRAQENLRVVDSAELRFTLDEAKLYFGDTVTAALVETVNNEAEGWPVALQLARLHLATTKNAAAVTAGNLVGRSADLAEYLAEQVLNEMPAELRFTLLRASVLERITGPLLDRMTCRGDGWQVLEQLQQANLFITSIDAERDWHRLHPLFAAYLRDRLVKAEPGILPGLHRAAAEWFLEMQLIPEAVRHAQAAGDADLLCRILEDAGGWRVALGGGTSLLRAFRDLHPDVVQRSPRLRLGQIYLMIQDGSVAEAQRAFDELNARTEEFTTPVSRDWHGDAMMLSLLLHIYRDAPIDAAQAGDFERALIGVRPFDAVTEGVAGELMAWLQYWNGDFQHSLESSRIAAQHCSAAGMTFVEAYCHLIAGAAELERGEIDRAEASLERSRDLAEQLCGPGSDKVRIVDVFLGEIALDRGDTETARLSVIGALDVLEEGETWVDLFRSAYAVALATGTPGDRSVLLRRAERFSERYGMQRVGLFAIAAEIRRSAVDGDPLPADRAARAEAFPTIAEAASGDWRSELDLLLAAADHALAAGKPAQVLALVQRVEVGLLARGQRRHLPRTRVLATAAYLRMRDGRAQAALKEAISCAAPMRMLRPFLEHAGDLAPLLAGNGERLGLASGSERNFWAELKSALAGREIPPAEAAERNDVLTPREQQVLALLALGQTSKEAAREMGVSVSTVMTHRKSIYRKLDATTRARALATARSIGLLH